MDIAPKNIEKFLSNGIIKLSPLQEKGALPLRKFTLILTSIIFIILCYFTTISAIRVIESDLELPEATGESSASRIVLITQDLDTPFWDQVSVAAKRKAEELGVSLEIWGNYGGHQEDFLRNLEIAIHSKVDGIIVQGLDTHAFKELTKIKASFYGIPVITIANDVPMNESLRRSYVGSNQYEAGKLIAEELIRDMGRTGQVILMYDNSQQYFIEQRIKGIEDTLKNYRNIDVFYGETPSAREEVITSTQHILNEVPNADAFIAVSANTVGAMVQEIGKRYQLDPFYIYSFDDSPESISLLKQGKIDGVIRQSPVEMGQLSVELMVKWLKGEAVPLNTEGYFTEIKILKANDLR